MLGGPRGYCATANRARSLVRSNRAVLCSLAGAILVALKGVINPRKMVGCRNLTIFEMEQNSAGVAQTPTPYDRHGGMWNTYTPTQNGPELHPLIHWKFFRCEAKETWTL